MQEEKVYKKLRPYHGILIFVLVLFMLLFVASIIQSRWGLYGVVVTEILIALFGIIPALLLKADLKEVIPVKIPKLRQIFGVIILWLGSLLTVLVVTMVIAYFFPDGLMEVSSGLQDVFTSVPVGISFLIVAVSPAICEEVLVRGFILSSFYSLQKKWLIVLIVGVLFGIFHLDPFRFLPTAILGMVLTYIMIETKNILLPALFHFINNGFSTITSFINPTEISDIKLYVPLEAIAVYLILGAAAPFVLLLGARLLQMKVKKKHPIEPITELDEDADRNRKKQQRKNIMVASIITILLFVTGIVMLTLSTVEMLTSDPVLETTIDMNINKDSDNLEIPFVVGKTGYYIMDTEIVNDRGLIDISIIDEKGDVINQTSCLWMNTTNNLLFEKGNYLIVVDFHLSDIEEYYIEKGFDFTDKVKEEFNVTGDLAEYQPFQISVKIRQGM